MKQLYWSSLHIEIPQNVNVNKACKIFIFFNCLSTSTAHLQHIGNITTLNYDNSKETHSPGKVINSRNYINMQSKIICKRLSKSFKQTYTYHDSHARKYTNASFFFLLFKLRMVNFVSEILCH